MPLVTRHANSGRFFATDSEPTNSWTNGDVWADTNGTGVPLYKNVSGTAYEIDKRTIILATRYECLGTLTAGNTFFFSPIGRTFTGTPGTSNDATVQRLISATAFHITRFRAYQTAGNTVEDLSFYNDTTKSGTLDLTGGNPGDSGAINIAYDGTETLSFSFDSLTSNSTYAFDIWLEIKWDLP